MLRADVRARELEERALSGEEILTSRTVERPEGERILDVKLFPIIDAGKVVGVSLTGGFTLPPSCKPSVIGQPAAVSEGFVMVKLR